MRADVAELRLSKKGKCEATQTQQKIGHRTQEVNQGHRSSQSKTERVSGMNNASLKRDNLTDVHTLFNCVSCAKFLKGD